ncbi:MAG: U32 family peptidase [Bacteroidota bacterium]|nr:MAG: U32 family peptidase [Bacteroidota bacterium]
MNTFISANTFKREEIEIMAPVGSFESLMAAVQAGADSVYFGLSKMNMRARSSVNFTEEDLDKILEICREHKIKAYLTLNIVIYQDELEDMHRYIDLVADKGITAIIASDPAVIGYARSKGVNVHISTQVNISNIDAVRFYAAFSDVMVLARELNLEQVQDIYGRIELEQIKGPSGELVRLEMFVHGALCMAVSGKCYLSLHEHNQSANRGACLQVCRRAYEVKDKDTGIELEIDNEYIMSPKDLSTIHFINKIIDAGVRILKIEGRARPAEYVFTVVDCYRQAVESLLDGSFGQEKIEAWQKRLSSVFNRGFWDGYYLGQRLGEWSGVYGSKAMKTKVLVGKCTNYFTQLGVAEFSCEASVVETGDELLVTGPTTGVVSFKVDEIREDLVPVQKTTQGVKFSVKTPQVIRRNDKLFKWVNTNA